MSLTESLSILRARVAVPTAAISSPDNSVDGDTRNLPQEEHKESKKNKEVEQAVSQVQDVLRRSTPQDDGSVSFSSEDWQTLSTILTLLLSTARNAKDAQFTELGRLFAGERGEKVRLVESYRRVASKCSEMEKQLNTTLKEKEDGTAEIDRLQKKLHTVEQNAVKNESQASIAIRRFRDAQQKLMELEASRSSSEDTASLESERNRLNTMIAELQEALKDSDDKIERERQDKRELRDRIELLEKLTVVLRSDLSKYQGRRVRKNELEALKVKLAEAKAEVEGLRVKLVREEREWERRGEKRALERMKLLEQEASARESALRELKSERDRLRAFIIRYESELKRRERELDKLRAKIQRTVHNHSFSRAAGFGSSNGHSDSLAKEGVECSTNVPARGDNADRISLLEAQETSRVSESSLIASLSSTKSRSGASSGEATGTDLMARMNELEAQVKSMQGIDNTERDDATTFWERGSSYDREAEEESA